MPQCRLFLEVGSGGCKQVCLLSIRGCLETYGIIMSGEEASGGDKPNFAGKYVLVKNENFDEFLGANGMTLHFFRH